MSKRVYRIRQLASYPGQGGILPVSAATLWRWVKAGKFPQPFKLGEKVTVWDAAEVEAFIQAQRAGGEVAAHV